jgi:hypothetical protein
LLKQRGMKTRLISSFVVVALFVMVCRAARADEPPAWMPTVSARVDAGPSKAVQMKRAGQALSAVGTLAFIASQALLGIHTINELGRGGLDERCRAPGSCPPTAFHLQIRDATIGTFVAASALLTTGIPLWAVGAKDARKEASVPRLSIGATSIRLTF